MTKKLQGGSMTLIRKPSNLTLVMISIKTRQETVIFFPKHKNGISRGKGDPAGYHSDARLWEVGG
jgi:hypothetical protein